MTHCDWNTCSIAYPTILVFECVWKSWIRLYDIISLFCLISQVPRLPSRYDARLLVRACKNPIDKVYYFDLYCKILPSQSSGTLNYYLLYKMSKQRPLLISKYNNYCSWWCKVSFASFLLRNLQNAWIEKAVIEKKQPVLRSAATLLTDGMNALLIKQGRRKIR